MGALFAGNGKKVADYRMLHVILSPPSFFLSFFFSFFESIRHNTGMEGLGSCGVGAENSDPGANTLVTANDTQQC
jgi:hypothetical protein